MTFEPRNVFITGGAGFIGANFVRHWLAHSREGRVVVFDALTYAGNIDNLAGLDTDPRYVFVKGDICDEATVRALLDGRKTLPPIASSSKRQVIALANRSFDCGHAACHRQRQWTKSPAYSREHTSAKCISRSRQHNRPPCQPRLP